MVEGVVPAGAGIASRDGRSPMARERPPWLVTRAAVWRLVAMAMLLAVLCFLSVYPLAMLFYGSIHSTPPATPGVFNLDGYRAIADSHNLPVVWNTVSLAAFNTAISVCLAIGLAWIIARTDTPGRGALEVLITLPFFVPPILTQTSWGMLANANAGSLNLIWEALVHTRKPLINIYSYGGVLWSMMQLTTPFIFMFIVDAFRSMDPALEEAGRMAGASRWRTFHSITLILLMPIISSAFILSFTRGIESFESALVFGLPAHIEVLTTRIYDAIEQSEPPDFEFATALGFVMLAFMFVLVVAQWRVLARRSFTTVTGRGFRPNITPLGPWRWLTFAFCVLFFAVTFLLPVGQLLVGSFFRFLGFYTWKSLTLQHYRDVWDNDEFWRAFRNTGSLGLMGATVTMVLGSLVAWVTTRGRWRGRHLIEAIAWLPWMMPGIVLAVGLMWAYALLPGPIQIYSTIWALLAAYVTLGSPVAVRIMSGVYAQFSNDLEECSRVHGASWPQTMWRIMVALAWPSMAVGWVLIFFGILRELSASILLYAAGSEVLSVEILKMWSKGDAEQVCVVGLLILALVLVFRWAQFRFVQRRLRMY